MKPSYGSSRLGIYEPNVFTFIHNLKQNMLIKSNRSLIDLSIGAPNRPTPAWIIHELQDQVSKPQFHSYPPPHGCSELLSLIHILEVMKQLALSGMTMMIVSHEMGFAREAANKISFIDQGNIVEISDKDEFFRNPKHERTKAFLSKIL